MKQTEFTQARTAEICRGLSLLLHGGLSLADSAWLLQQDARGEMKAVLTRLGQLLDGGSPLADAMEESGGFPAYATAMTRVGEETGHLEKTLTELADYYEENDRTVRQLKNALAYPCMILLLMLLVIGVLLIKVLPVFDSVYASLGSRLTGVSAGLLYLGQLLAGAMPVLLAVLMLAAVLVLLLSRWTAFREKATVWFLARFGDRGIVRKFNNARFARALALGIGSGLPLEEALALARQPLASVPGAAARLDGCCRELEAGVALAEALQNAGLLPAWAGRMLSAGIRGGNADTVMEEITKRMMEEARTSLAETVSRVEPAMVLLSSVLVGVILLSTMLPLMNIMASIG